MNVSPVSPQFRICSIYASSRSCLAPPYMIMEFCPEEFTWITACPVSSFVRLIFSTLILFERKKSTRIPLQDRPCQHG